MQTATDNITRLAARAASILMQWAGLNSLRKNDTGDQGPLGGMGMVLGLLARGDPGPLAESAEGKMTAHIEAQLRAQIAEDDRVYYVLDVDYGPGRELVELTVACELNCEWPFKSYMSVRANSYDPGTIALSEVTYALVTERNGWLVTKGFSVDSRIRAIVVDAVIAGSNVATFEPFKVASDKP